MRSTEFADPMTPARLARFRRNFNFYSPRALKIRSKTGATLPLFLNTAQQYIHKRIEEQRERIGYVRAIILKGRQQGCSTYVEGRFYWKVSGERGKYAYILTHEDKATKNLFAMVDRYHTNCPAELRPHKGAAKGFALAFDLLDSGYDVGTAKTAGTGRSGTYQYFHGSEVAYWPNAEAHMAGVGQAVPLMAGTEIILESTAAEYGNLFHRKWQAAVAGEADAEDEGTYIPIFVPWFWQEEYRRPVGPDFTLDADEAEYMELYECTPEQMAWRRWKIANDLEGDETLWKREYPATPEEAFEAGLEGSYITPTEVNRAKKTENVEAYGAKVLGVDVGEYGPDPTVLVRRHGRVVLPIRREDVLRRQGTMAAAGRVAQVIDDWEPDAVFVDVTGVGSGVVDRLHELGYVGLVTPVHNGGKPTDDKLYVRKRDEQWGEMRQWLRSPPCKLPEDGTLSAELTQPQYKYDSSRRLVIEPKEKMQARGLKSPDHADALALTFAYPVTPKRPETRSVETGGRTYRRASWDTA